MKIETWVKTGRLDNPPVAIRRDEHLADLRERGVDGPAADLIVSALAPIRHRSRVDVARFSGAPSPRWAGSRAAWAALRHAISANDDRLGTEEGRRTACLEAAALCAIETGVRIGTRGGLPAFGRSTFRQRWAAALGKGRKDASDGGAWNAALGWAVTELHNAGAGFGATPQDVLGRLVPARAAFEGPVPGGAVAYWPRQHMPVMLMTLERQWICAVAHAALIALGADGGLPDRPYMPPVGLDIARLSGQSGHLIRAWAETYNSAYRQDGATEHGCPVDLDEEDWVDFDAANDK